MMEYRRLGRTELLASKIDDGAERADILAQGGVGFRGRRSPWTDVRLRRFQLSDTLPQAR
jgi:hypothetical protein